MLMESASSDTTIIHSNDEIRDENSDLNTSMEGDGKEKSGNDIHGSRVIGVFCERPTSLQLESVLEYTNRIKTFLGLQDEEEPDTEVPHDSSIMSHGENSGNGSKVNPDLSSHENSSTSENISMENAQSKPDDSTPTHNVLNLPKSTLQPLPDIIGVQPDYPEEAERDQFPDILERSKNVKNEKSIYLNSQDITADKISDISVTSDNNDDLRDLKSNIVSSGISPQNETVYEEEPLAKAGSKNYINLDDVKKNEVSPGAKSEDESNATQNDDNTLFLGRLSNETKKGLSALERKSDQVDGNGISVRKEDQDEGNSYQITHIEEGLRQAEKNLKSTLPKEPDEQQFNDVSQEPDEQQTMIEDIPQEPDSVNQNDPSDRNPPVLLKRRSKLSMEDIRRLSTEVVNSVLQTAGDEVKVLLQNRDVEENKPLSTTNVDSLDDPEVTLRDTEVEFHDKLKEISLADIPEEKPLRTFSTGTTTSIAMKASKHSIDRIEVTDEIDFDTQCGFGPFKPQCIQRYATANVYVILYSIIGILHGSYYTYLVGVLTTLEKRFEFKSKTSGFIMMLDELTPLFLGVLVGHLGGRAHRPRLLSFGMFLSAFCCFASALPYFLYGTATHLSSVGSVHSKASADMCNGDVRKEHCGDDDRPPTITAILLLMLGSFLKGFGNLAYYAIGLAYLDDNAKKRNTPLYFAFAFALRLLGPMVGFLMSSAFLKYYENPFETPDFGPDDPRWIGGWWMGFVLQGILLLIFSGPMALFPRRLPDHRPLVHEMDHLSNTSMFDGLGDSLKRLARNPLYMLIGLNAIFTVYGNFGYYIMLPKYMENQFRLSASNASLFAGPPGIAALMVSCLIGGYLIWKFKPTAKFLAGGLVTLELISTIGYLILMIPQCEKIEMTHFGIGEESLILKSSCNMNCSCSTVQFTPVCGPDGKSYFSPCYAGCSFQQDQSFYNCSCVGDFSGNAVVEKGLCTSENCWSQALAYIITLPVLQFIVNILRVAYTMIMLRSIKPEDKNIALGVFETVLSTVAFIPFPVLYGALVDSACLVWEKSCGETGNCWFYDMKKFNYLMHGGSAFFCGLSTLNLVGIFFLVNRIKDLYKDEETEKTREGKTHTKQ